MNQLSWLLYLAGVSGNLQRLLSISALLLFLGTVGLGVWTLMSYADTYDDAKRKSYIVLWKKFSQWSISFAVICTFIACILPSRTTMYGIAASEFGEQLLHTKTASLAEQALNNWLQQQINTPPK